MRLRVLSAYLMVAITDVVGGGSLWSTQYRLAEQVRTCRTNGECRHEAGEVCWWLYDGCILAQCMCPPFTHVKDERTGSCVPVKLGGETCLPNDACGPRLGDMTCRNGTCQCITGTLHWSKELCIMHYQKILGERCDPVSDSCVQVTQYGRDTNNIHCSNHGRCTCHHGFRQEGETCRKLQLGESGCTKAFHCEGGAICVDGQCSCPFGYRGVAGRTKCAKLGAISDLPTSRSCDEINEEAYCGRGLVCHRCYDDPHSTCIRYNLYNQEKIRQLFSHSSSLSASRMTVVFASLIVILSILLSPR